MDAQTCILTRRSVRKFTDEPVSRELLEKVVALAAYAPSWKNTQISRYLAIEDPAVQNTIAEEYCLAGANNPNIIKGAPLLVAQTFVKDRCGYNRDGTFTTDREDGWQYYDCGIAAPDLLPGRPRHGAGHRHHGGVRPQAPPGLPGDPPGPGADGPHRRGTPGGGGPRPQAQGRGRAPVLAVT